MKRSVLAFVVLAFAALACGGSQSTEPAADPAPTEPAPIAEPSPEQKLRAQQEASCRPMCERITDCAIADAQANLSADELAKLDLENTGPRNTDQCADQCNASALSPRQIQSMRDCISVESDCETYLACLDAIRQGA